MISGQKLRQFTHRKLGYQGALLAAFFLPFCVLPAQRHDFEPWRERRLSSVVRGAAFRGEELLLWGDAVTRVELRRLKLRRLAAGRYASPGCLADINGDSLLDPVLLEQPAEQSASLGKLVWLESPSYAPRLIDTEAAFTDCIATRLFGESGILLVHRGAQVRFYRQPPDPRERWPYRELYSIYTPSAQGGLLRADIDNDGYDDILTGNYWLRSPALPEDSWRLFPINNWWEGPETARLRLGYSPPMVIAAEAGASPARVSRFLPPAVAGELWTEAPLDAMPPIRKPEAMVVADLNDNGRADIVIGENAGTGSRLLVYWGLDDHRFQGVEIARSRGLLAVGAADVNRDGLMDLIGASAGAVTIWRGQRRK
jgi:hypothetical protein